MERELVLICEDVRSLWNVGAIFRTADALGIAKVYLCGITGRPPRQEISKTALGAEEWVPWEYRAAAWELARELREQGYEIVALEQTSKSIPLSEYKPKFPLALMVGNELQGVSKNSLKAVDQAVQIPMIGKKESLNVAVAAGIAVFEIFSVAE